MREPLPAAPVVQPTKEVSKTWKNASLGGKPPDSCLLAPEDVCHVLRPEVEVEPDPHLYDVDFLEFSRGARSVCRLLLGHHDPQPAQEHPGLSGGDGGPT